MKSPASTTVTAGGTKQRQQQSGPTKRSRVATASARAADNRAASPPTPLAIIAPASLGTLPLPLVSEIGAFSAGGFLSGACRTTLEALRELHYKVDMEVHAHSFSEAEDILCHTSTEHMGLQADGALVTGRAVTRITIKGCGDRQDQEAGYEVLEKAIKRVVRHSIPTLRSITIKARGQSCNRIAAVLDALVPLSTKQYRVASNLVRVELVDGPSGVAKAGRAIAAGLWPALEELVVARCHANAEQFKKVAQGIASGKVPNLRVLNWDRQTYHRRRPLDDVLLLALSAGKCPLIESLSFTDNRFCPEFSIFYIRQALRACPKLQELRMDCSRTPRNELVELVSALREGSAPHLASLFVRSTKAYHMSDETKPAVQALRETVQLRIPPVCVEVQIKTEYSRAVAHSSR